MRSRCLAKVFPCSAGRPQSWASRVRFRCRRVATPCRPRASISRDHSGSAPGVRFKTAVYSIVCGSNVVATPQLRIYYPRLSKGSGFQEVRRFQRRPIESHERQPGGLYGGTTSLVPHDSQPATLGRQPASPVRDADGECRGSPYDSAQELEAPDRASGVQGQCKMTVGRILRDRSWHHNCFFSSTGNEFRRVSRSMNEEMVR
jgi:hypothetical protein